jgi:hypothetical protein
MSSKKSSTTTQGSFDTISEVPAWLEAGSKTAAFLAHRRAWTPYQKYTGQRVAELTPDEQTAMSNIRLGQNAWQPDLERARQLTEQGARQFTNANIGEYMNPYIEQALDPAARMLERENLKEQQRVGSQAAEAGAFGGSRATLLQTETARGGREALSDLYSRGYASAFEDAANRFNEDRDAARKAAEQFRATGAQTQQQMYQDINALLQSGGMQRTLRQANLDFDYEQFINAKNWDVNSLQNLVSTLATVPTARREYGTETGVNTSKQKGSVFGTILGGAALAAGVVTGNPGLVFGGASVLGGAQAGGGAGGSAFGSFLNASGQSAMGAVKSWQGNRLAEDIASSDEPQSYFGKISNPNYYESALAGVE